MPCYSPLHAYKDKGKDASKTLITFSRPKSWRGEPLDLPCGQCIGCRLERSRQWAVRCMHEASLYKKNSFVTLTYNDEKLPSDNSLHKSHFQDFMKRLRKKYFPNKIRYYHCGEYGEKNGRPHYHALLFNLDFEDKKLHSVNHGNPLFVSNTLDSVWKNGYALIGDVNFDSAAYVARYIMKKVLGKGADSFYGDLEREYSTMSRRPGIGQGWFDLYRGDVYPHDRLVVNGVITRPPRYYDNLLGKDDPSTLAFLKINREKNGLHFVDDVLSDGTKIRVNDSCDSRLLIKEVVKKAQISNLKRPLEEI